MDEIGGIKIYVCYIKGRKMESKQLGIGIHQKFTKRGGCRPDFWSQELVGKVLSMECPRSDPLQFPDTLVTMARLYHCGVDASFVIGVLSVVHCYYCPGERFGLRLLDKFIRLETSQDCYFSFLYTYLSLVPCSLHAQGDLPL